MKVCGIIAEYNPFHLGHLYHLKQTRNRLSADCAFVIIMSGNYVQRGEPAIFSSYARAEMAVRCGADLVLELPLTATLSSAEGFARGGIRVLNSLGFITHLSFGSESGDLSSLSHTAELLIAPNFTELLKKELANGFSYAAARQRALAHTDPTSASLLKGPNNILAIEYIKALLETGSSISPLTIARRETKHDDNKPKKSLCSASYIRRQLPEHPEICRAFMPSNAYSIMTREMEAGHGPYSVEKLELLLLAQGRRLSPKDMALLPDASEGLENRLSSALYHAVSLSQCLNEAKSRRYPESRIRRMLLCSLLGITKDLSRMPPAYLRVLAFNERGRFLLKQAKTSCSLPFLIRPTASRKLTDNGGIRLAALDLFADDLFGLIQPKPLSGGSHYRKTPFYLPNSIGIF